MRRTLLSISFALAFLMAFLPFAAALPGFPPIVLKLYSPKADGIVQKAAEGCNLCHVSSGPPKLNPYGEDLRAALKAAATKTLTPEILKSVESKDSDGDGATNTQEFAEDTLPGDPSSKPAHITPAPKTAPTPAAAATDSAPGPWSLKALLFPSHAQHPIIVHFPVALLLIGLFFDLLGVRTRNKSLLSAGYYNISAAAFFAPLTVLTGLLAWWFGQGHPALEGTILYHLILGIVSLLVIWGLWFLRRGELRRESEAFGIAYIVLGTLAFPLIAITGHLGGILVYGG